MSDSYPSNVAKNQPVSVIGFSFRQDWGGALLLILAVLLVYSPLWNAGYIWDDDYHLTNNPCIIGPLGLKEIWTTSAGQFFPLVLTTFWIEHALWGLHPLGYHVVNVLFQAFSALVLWRILRRLRIPGAWLGAALWALHPMQVESVAWVSELKNTQSGFFYLLTILYFLRWLEAKEKQGAGVRDYSLTLLCAFLAMASKSSTVVLPAVLALCAWWMEGKFPWRYIGRLAPIALMSLVSIVVTVWPHPVDPAVVILAPQTPLNWYQRIALSGDVFWFYLGKLVWPHPLMAIYPHWEMDMRQTAAFLPLLGAVLVLSIVWIQRGSLLRPVFFALAYYLIVLSPFLGLIDQTFWRYSYVQDHLQDIASMGPLALLGAGLFQGSRILFGNKPEAPFILGMGLLFIFGFLSWQRVFFYKNDETLWTDSLAKNPDCWLGQYNLGVALLEKGDDEQAMGLYQKAIDLNPGYAPAQYNLADGLLQKGQVDQAIALFQKALEINPSLSRAHDNLGNALLQKGLVDEAITQYRKAIELKPLYAQAHYNLGLALMNKGQQDLAMAEFQRALVINPQLAEAHNSVGEILVKRGQLDQAIEEYQEAISLNTHSAKLHYNLATAFLQKSEFIQAIDQYQKTLALDPHFPQANYNLGVAYNQVGQVHEAMTQFQKAVDVAPKDTEARNNLGMLLAQSGQLDEARNEFEKAIQLTPANAEAHYNLGLVYYQTGMFAQAVSEFRETLRLEPNFPDVQTTLAKVQKLVPN